MLEKQASVSRRCLQGPCWAFVIAGLDRAGCIRLGLLDWFEYILTKIVLACRAVNSFDVGVGLGPYMVASLPLSTLSRCSYDVSAGPRLSSQSR